MHRKIFSFLILLNFFGCQSCPKKEEQEAKVFFITPKDGDTVKSPFEVKFGVKGMKVLPAGEDLNDKNTGHHHILIDVPKGYVERGLVITVDDKHLHFGKGETSTILNLPPGDHTLSLQFADGAHVSYGKELSKTIKITVLK